ncbi:hypothetical protein D3C72_955050 [compost metagenome]
MQIIVQRRHFHCQLRLRLMHALAIDAVINLQQQIAFFDLHEILHLYLGDIAVNLRADKGGLPAHIGVIRELTVAGKGRQLPGVEDHQHPDNPYRRCGKNGNNAQIIAGSGLLFGGILLTHNLSGGNALFILGFLPLFGARGVF